MEPTEIPILVYHDISDTESPWCVSPQEFEAQMKLLKQEGYHTISLTELDERIKNNSGSEKKLIVLTFDDARKGAIITAYPLLKKLSFTATVFIVPQWIDRAPLPPEENYSDFLTWEELKQLKNSGWGMGSHTFSHRNLKEIDKETVLKELTQAENAIAQHLNTKPEHFAYPFGEYNDQTISEVQKHYKTAVTISRGFDRIPFQWSRQCIMRGTTEEHFKKLLEKPTLSLCMIVRNEEHTITNCLNSVKDLVDEIIIVDTGSTDKTQEIAQKFTKKIYTTVWQNNFSTARNFSLQHATGDWIFILDADEIIDESDHKKILEAINNWKVLGYQMISRNYTSTTAITGWQPVLAQDPLRKSPNGWYPSIKVRLFQRKPGITFFGEIHEMVENAIEAQGGTIKMLSVPVHHYGTLEGNAQEKMQRYIELTKKKLAAQPTAKAYFELGIQYKEQGNFGLAEKALEHSVAIEEKSIYPRLNLAIVQQKQEKIDQAIENFRKVAEQDPTGADAYFGLGYCFFKKNEYQKAIDNFEQAVHHNPNLVDAYANLGALYERTGEYQKALNALRNALTLAPRHAQAYYNLGVVHEKLHNFPTAIEAYQKAIELNYRRKEELKKKIEEMKQTAEKE